MRLAQSARCFRWWHEAALVLMLIGLLAASSFVMPNFLGLRRQLLLTRHLWEFAILALPMTLIIITAGIDLSIGSAMGLCAVTFGGCFAATGSVVLSCLACLVVGAGCGALNGALVSQLRLHPLIVTLATYAGFRGIAEGISEGASRSQFGAEFSQLARGTWGGVPVPAYLFLILAVAFAFFLGRTPTGRFIYAIGHNETAARFSGIRVERIRLWLYTTSGVFAGLATIIYVSRFDTAKADAGSGFELDVITAVLIGGTSIFGGRGNIVGTVLGLLLIHETRTFVSSYWQMDELRTVVIGFLLITSVLAYRVLRRPPRSV